MKILSASLKILVARLTGLYDVTKAGFLPFPLYIGAIFNLYSIEGSTL
jgi:hypothetical protein